MDQFENRWWDPGELLAAAHAISDPVESKVFFRNPNYKQVREMIVAAEFALKRPWNKDWQVRPVPEGDEFPDCELRCGNDVLQFEIVEADKEDRHRGDEYCAASGKSRKIESYDPVEEARAALDAIMRVLQKKAAKKYSSNPNLLIYVNLSRGKLTEDYANDLAQQFGQHFASAWLLWQSVIFRLWPNPAKIKDT